MSDDLFKVGLNIRTRPDSKSEKIGLLPRGAKLEIGEKSANGKWGKIKNISEGEILPVYIDKDLDPAARTGWVFLGELDPETEPKALDTVVFPDKSISIGAGDLIGYMGEYQEYFDARSTAARGIRPLLHVEIFSGDDVPKFVAKSREYAKALGKQTSGLFVIEKGAKLVDQAKADLTLNADERVLPARGASQTSRWIKVLRVQAKVMDRKELGVYEPATKGYANGSVFTGWYVGPRGDQRTQSEADAKKLGYTYREVWMPHGNAIWVERTAYNGGNTQNALHKSIPAWSKFPLDLKGPSMPAADFARVITPAEFEQTSTDDKATDANGSKWWKVSVRTNTIAGQPAHIGWVCEKDHPLTSWQSPWAWPGFDFLEEKAQPEELFSSWLVKSGLAKPHEYADFKARADTLDSGELFQKIYKLLDVNKDKVINKQELVAAAKQPLLQQTLTRMVVKYESEWGGDMAKWHALDPLMLDDKTEWQAEKIRIDQLRWWPKVAAKVKDFPGSPEAFHFHPIALVANFSGTSSCPKECVVEFITLDVSSGKYRASKAVMEWMLETENYEQKPYVPSGKSASGITIGYGYDLGHQSEASIRSDLVGLYTAEQIEKFVGVAGLKQGDARSALSKVSGISISKDNALTLAMRLKKSYAEQVISIYPAVTSLHPYCQGALLSLVFNRGTDMGKVNESSWERRREMREIRDDLRGGNYKGVPGRIRSMKRLWEGKGQGGLLVRRDKEADFFERGVKCDCWE